MTSVPAVGRLVRPVRADLPAGPLVGPARRHEFHPFGRNLEVWVARLRPHPYPPAAWDDARWADAVRSLSAAERARCAVISHPPSRIQYAAGRVLIRGVLGRVLGLPPARVPLTERPGGKPCLANGSGDRAACDFNLSHSGGYLALAVCRGLRVGVDIEQTIRRQAHDRLADRYFAEHERVLLGPDPAGADRPHGFDLPDLPELPDRARERVYLDRWYRIWTTREAHAKARGVGVVGLADPLAGHGIRWRQQRFPVADRYVGTVVAIREPDRPYDWKREH